MVVLNYGNLVQVKLYKFIPLKNSHVSSKFNMIKQE